MCTSCAIVYFAWRATILSCGPHVLRAFGRLQVACKAVHEMTLTSVNHITCCFCQFQYVKLNFLPAKLNLKVSWLLGTSREQKQYLYFSPQTGGVWWQQSPKDCKIFIAVQFVACFSILALWRRSTITVFYCYAGVRID